MKQPLNIANRLTLLRVLMVPLYVYFYLDSHLIPAPYNQIVALVIFVVACFTDYLDGHLARARHLVSNFGKFMDPLADKLLICSALICFVESGEMAAWVVVILIGREFIISGFRLVAATEGVVIAADIWGKSKTVVQMIAVIMLLVPYEAQWFYVMQQVMVYASAVLTVISVVNYMKNNWQVLQSQ